MSDANSDERLVFNGVNVDTGGYLLEPRTVEEVASAALGVPQDERRLGALQDRLANSAPGVLAPIAGVDIQDIGESGWGVIFPAGVDAAPLLEALAPLIALRREQAGKLGRFRIYQGADGVRPGQGGLEWLSDHGGGPGAVDPDQIPYYLLIVGDPEQISFQFQFDLDVQHAVGRICFDTPDEYHSYARSVVAAERQEVLLPRRCTFFGVENPDDGATRLSMAQLVNPLFERFSRIIPHTRDLAGWQAERLIGAGASKDGLARLLGGEATPGLLFTASHGAGFQEFASPAQAERQRRLQGALVTAEWQGPQSPHPMTEEQFLSGEDIGSDARLLGMVAFMFACFGAGTPLIDEFAHLQSLGARPQPIAPRPFVARLPQRMLGHPRGGALAVIGHVERATGYSFTSRRTQQQTQDFYSALYRLLSGWPVGSALEYFNTRYANLGAELGALQTRRLRNEPVDPRQVTYVWTASNDARGYIIFGDPAVRLAVSRGGETKAVALEPATFAAGRRPSSPVSGSGEAEAPTTAPATAVPTTPPAPADAEPAGPPVPTDGGGAGQPSAPATASEGGAEATPAARGAAAAGLPQDIRISLAGGGVLSLRLDVSLPPGAGGTVAQGGPPGAEEGPAVFGWPWQGGAAQGEGRADDTLGKKLQEFARTVAERLETFVQDAATLEVRTYVSGDLERVELKEGRVPGVNPRALTFIQLDGDTVVVVPESEGELDQALWKVHTDMVQQAQATRAEMLRTLLDAATRLLGR
ncbi:MAG TPA: C25 family cysteine peptidase [Roseiflexaceae bacterium]|nr:C25 family cysteine peptidase [Roseiflexaceae bacterium]